MELYIDEDNIIKSKNISNINNNNNYKFRCIVAIKLIIITNVLLG